ncbi:MAG: phospholipase D family protein [Saprospiraceae bacterium]|nr:phospholipase D family protein [Saprospiraceae bacterium]
MLNAKKNHLDYGHLLMPPPGFRLKKAVATTYSLDLQALLAVPVAMYYSRPADLDLNHAADAFDVLSAIDQASKSVLVFCQKGKIHLPRKYHRLLLLTEDCIAEITPPMAMSSFHPKCWWLYFEHPERLEKVVRFAILSRNFTFDRSWDVAFAFEGPVGPAANAANQPMLDMLAYLEQASGRSIDQEFKTAVGHTQFHLEPPFDRWHLHPIGIGASYTNPLASAKPKSDVLLAMSPFLDDKSVRQTLAKCANHYWLFSRKEELGKLQAVTLQAVTQTYCIPDVIVSGEYDDQKTDLEAHEEAQSLDLHAKLYLMRSGARSTWLLGSANLTAPAFGRNIECLIELSTTDPTASPESMMNELVSDKRERRLFEPVEPVLQAKDDTGDNIDQQLRRLEYQLINCPFSGTAVPDKNQSDTYRYQMFFDATGLDIASIFSVHLSPFSNLKWSDDEGRIQSGMVNELTFQQALRESQLSRFFVLTIKYSGDTQRQFLLKADIDLPKTRNGRILSEILDSKEKFLQYLQFLLSENGVPDQHQALAESIAALQNGSAAPEGPWARFRFPIYEQLLKTASQRPDKMKSIDDLFQRLGAGERTKDVIPVELLELWQIFKEVVDHER